MLAVVVEAGTGDPPATREEHTPELLLINVKGLAKSDFL